jgi:protein SCO1/2
LLILAACARSYRVEGLVLAVDPASRTLTVSHREIPDYMPAMAMPFQVARGEPLEGLRSGSRVEFDLRGSLARRIRVVGAGNLIDDVRLEPTSEKLDVGEVFPDFTLPDQAGRTARLSDFAGRLVVVNFIYTRCPLPEVCPRLSASFAALQRRFASEIPARLILVSITLDPQFDVPDVLRRYAESVGARAGWSFLTGAKAEIEAVARRIGLVHWPEEGVIVHTSMTGLIGRDRRLVAVVEGSSFRLEQLADLVRHHLGGNR